MADTDKLHDIVKDLQAEDAARRERMAGFSASLDSSCGIRRDQLFPNERPYDFSSTPVGPVELSVPGVEEALYQQVARLEQAVAALQEANRQAAEQAAEADKDAQLARRQGRIANVISALALLVSLLVPFISYLLAQ